MRKLADGQADEIKNFLESQPSSLGVCDADYAPLFAKTSIDARLAIGYLDYADTSKPELNTQLSAVYFNQYDPGIGAVRAVGPNSPLFGILAYSQALRIIQSPCSDANASLACGFEKTEAPGEYRRNIPAPGGGSVEIKLRVTQAAASIFHDLNDNGGALSAIQQAFTAASEENFFNGLRQADIVLYLGHARNGGGPDFSVVVRDEYKHPDYLNHYKPLAPGFHKTQDALRERRETRSDSPFFLGLHACRSSQLFGSALRSLAPNMWTLTTGDLTYMPALLAGALGSLDAIMRRQCYSNFIRSATLPPKVAGNPVHERSPLAIGEDVQLDDRRAAATDERQPQPNELRPSQSRPNGLRPKKNSR
jgi:hypothetical protein